MLIEEDEAAESLKSVSTVSTVSTEVQFRIVRWDMGFVDVPLHRDLQIFLSQEAQFGLCLLMFLDHLQSLSKTTSRVGFGVGPAVPRDSVLQFEAQLDQLEQELKVILTWAFDRFPRRRLVRDVTKRRALVSHSFCWLLTGVLFATFWPRFACRPAV